MSFLRKVFENIPAKIASLLIAIAIWIFVGSGLAQIGTFPGKIPIEIKNVPEGLTVVREDESVSVKITADRSIWEKLDAQSFNASVDLSNLKIGTYQLPVQVTSGVSGVQIVEVNPQKILVRLEPIAEKEIPVVLEAQGKAADGYVVGDWKIKPDHVKISGASSVINKILEATAKITLNGEKDSFSRIAKVIAQDANGNEISDLNFSPTDIEVTVPLVQASTAKTVGIKVITIGQPADGFWVSQLESEPSTVAVTASSSLIGQISFVETKPVDINGLSSAKDFATTLKNEPGVTILDNLSLVKVKVTVSKIGSTRQFVTGFSWINLSSSLKVASADPSSATVVLSGSTEDLAKINSRDVVINLNLGSISSAGAYSLDINRANVSVPDGISFSSVVPSAVNVRVETR